MLLLIDYGGGTSTLTRLYTVCTGYLRILACSFTITSYVFYDIKAFVYTMHEQLDSHNVFSEICHDALIPIMPSAHYVRRVPHTSNKHVPTYVSHRYSFQNQS